MRSAPRACLAAVLALAVLGARPVPPADPNIPQLFAAYRAGTTSVLAETIPTEPIFDRLDKALFGIAMRTWTLAPEPAHGAFMLDLANLALARGWSHWLDVVDTGRQFVSYRTPATRGDAAADAVELSWYKAASALMEGTRRPDLLESTLSAPVIRRVVAERTDPSDTRIIDPWIEILAGGVDEQYSVVKTETFRARAGSALKHFDRATQFDATRAEGTIRKAWTLLRLDRAADALATLDAWDRRSTDPSFTYLAQLFRGRILDTLNRPVEAGRAYEQALELVPNAQSPLVALTALAVRQSQPEIADRWRSRLRSAPATSDPWWDYWYEEHRLFRARVTALREMR